jgi:hypothetical protein
MPLDRYYLNLVGEYRVASELLERGLFATIIYGHVKGIDIFVVGEDVSRVRSSDNPITLTSHAPALSYREDVIQNPKTSPSHGC